MKAFSARVLRFALFLVLVAFGVVIYGYWCVRIPVSFDANKFNENIWTAAEGLSGTWSCRWQMAGDIQNNSLKKGMTRGEVTDLLGEPDAGNSKPVYSYNLGDWGPRALFTVYYTLDVRFDKSGCVARVGRTRHKGEFKPPSASKKDGKSADELPIEQDLKAKDKLLSQPDEAPETASE